MAAPPRSGPSRWLRLAGRSGRWLALVATIVLAWPGAVGSWASAVLPSASPFVAVASVLARAAGWMALLALPVAVLSWFRPRWLCRHACPLGLLLDLVEGRRPRRAEASRPRRPVLGRAAALLAFGGALLGYPWFLWMDPLAVGPAFLHAWRPPLAAPTLAAGLVLPAILLLGLVAPRLWCRHLCPLGGTLDWIQWVRRKLRRPNRNARQNAPAAGPGPLGDRRAFLAAGAGLAGAAVLRAASDRSRTVLRPPGSRDEVRFAGLCVRCGNCGQACPSRIIEPDWRAEGGVAAWLAPRLRFDQDYCREDCRRCGEVCPSGAIASLTMEEKRRHLIGRAVVEGKICLLAQGRECTACLAACPYEALVMASRDGGFTNEPLVVPDRCNGCGACESVCPTRPTRAITVRGQPDRRT